MIKNKIVQTIAKQTIEYIKGEIYVGQNLCEIRQLCEHKMLELGADSFWYYDIGAFVFCGDETALSVSGRKYRTSDKQIKENDIITIDLSPKQKGLWGDYARTLVIENGRVADHTEIIINDEWRNGLAFEKKLHNVFKEFVNPKTTFEDVYFYMNDYIENSGYVNLDFKGNLGHSVNRHKYQRVYIEKGNKKCLGSVKGFTFEPHISVANSNYGFKREDIYYFNNGKLCVL